jgi:hypothetical protein
MSKNAPTIRQIKLTCRHVIELVDAGMTENLAIRNLELYANIYAKYLILGNTNPDHVDQYMLWSKAARKARVLRLKRASGQYLRVEHGTPRRQFARDVLEAFKKRKLTKKWLDNLCQRKWKVAVITHEEDKRLTKLTRSKSFRTPESRWAAGKLKF